MEFRFNSKLATQCDFQNLPAPPYAVAAMKLHFFNFKPNGIIRIIWHLAAGYRLCGRSFSKLRQVVPESINSMSTANNFSAVIKNLPAPKTLLDIGANVSQMAKLLLLTLPDGVKVFSFEPNPDLKPMGKVFYMALGEKDGTAKFYLPADSTWGTIVKSKAETWETKVLDMKIRRFDSLLASGEIKREELTRPIMAKIDTEGCELQTLKGFGEFLKEIDYLMLEVTNPQFENADNETLKIYRYLADQGFTSSKVLYAGHDGSSAPDYMDVFFWKGTIP